MQLHPDGTLVVSATDLVGFLACDHLATLELGRVEGRWERPPEREDPEVVLLQQHGDAHELAYLEALRTSGLTVHAVDREALRTPDDLRAAERETLEAMRAGVDVVYQATFFDGRWRGHADFLLKVDRPSALGDWSYEVADTKLSLGVKGSAVLQVCVYSERLATLQGLSPERVHIVTGDGRTHPLRLEDYAAYYREVKRRFEARLLVGLDGGPATYPDPVDHCRVCAWFPTCIDRRRADDHLSLVAGMSRAATERLSEAGIATLEALGELPADRAIADLNAGTLRRLRDQARLQLDGRRQGRLRYELIEPSPDEPGRGLAALPEPSPGDLFFDIEADPWIAEGGLEYLLGVLAAPAGEPEYRPLWGHDRAGEKAAFEAFVDLVIDRLDGDPRMHVYHYGGYESGAIKRLVRRHATREDEVDRILRGKALVDLLQVVRQGVRASVESYSLKEIEHFYLPGREGPVTTAGFSVVAYETWLQDGDPRHIDELAAYNRDDCVSTWRLRGWLEARRREAIDRGWPIERPPLESGLPGDARAARDAATTLRVEALTRGVPADRLARTDEEQGRWLLAQLLDWHRREAKPAWWLWFSLRDRASAEELIESGEALGGLEFERDVAPRGRGGMVRRYRFPPQDHKFRPGSEAIDPATDQAVEVVALGDAGDTIDVFRSRGNLDHHPRALIPRKPLETDPMRDALARIADWAIEHGIDAHGPWRPARDLLLRRRPRLAAGLAGGPLAGPGETPLEAACRLALELDGGVLPIQGPPGTGKTYAGGEMIARLLAAGRRVGITAQSHKAITNLLVMAHEACGRLGVPFRAIQRCDNGDDGSHLSGVDLAASWQAVAEGLAAGRYEVVAATSWVLSRPELVEALDVLFVDEAGQLALANAVAMGAVARSIVLLGDPNQLPQVTQGVHPEGAGASALEHLVGDAVTVPAAAGLFLDRTYRLHPAINDYTSPAFYEGRLTTDPSTIRQDLEAPRPWNGVGVRWVPVSHTGDDSDSPAEAESVAATIDALLDGSWTDRFGDLRPMTIDDILVVTPYNAQVARIQTALRRRLDTYGRVGTVDKFQGQEGAVAIYSMTTSSVDDAPRGMDFLYDGHRLNVAVSRARVLAVVVASPELLRVHARTPEQMRLANALCRLVEIAAEQRAAEAGPPAPPPVGPTR